MKYIRTKGGIVDLSKVTIGENGWKNIEEYIAFKQEDQEEPIKQADTIEDLVDLYVLDDRKDKHHYIENEINLLPCIYIYDKENTSVYGEIWVDGELHKVAKLNEKGELELL